MYYILGFEAKIYDNTTFYSTIDTTCFSPLTTWNRARPAISEYFRGLRTLIQASNGSILVSGEDPRVISDSKFSSYTFPR